MVKDSALLLLWLRSLLWCRFDPWTRNFYMPWERQKKKKKKFHLPQHQIIPRNKLKGMKYKYTKNCRTLLKEILKETDK